MITRTHAVPDTHTPHIRPTGLPFADALGALGQLAEEDELVSLAVASIPAAIASEGCLTSTQLQRWFWDVERDAGRLALVPKLKPGRYSRAHTPNTHTHP